jgi:hypothetical protein
MTSTVLLRHRLLLQPSASGSCRGRSYSSRPTSLALTCLDHSGIVDITERLDARLVKGVAPTGRVSSSLRAGRSYDSRETTARARGARRRRFPIPINNPAGVINAFPTDVTRPMLTMRFLSAGSRRSRALRWALRGRVRRFRCPQATPGAETSRAGTIRPRVSARST